MNKKIWRIATIIILAALIALATYLINTYKEEEQMPLDPQTAAAISGTIDTASTNLSIQNANRKNRRFAEKMYDRQRNDALADWNAMNAYNSPAAQMERLKEAGLNPSLMYGGGGGSIMQSATVRSADMGKYEHQPGGTALGPTMAAAANIKLANAQTDNVEAQTEVARADKMNKIIQGANMAYEGEHSKFDLARKNELTKVIFEKGVADLDMVKASIDASVHGNQRAQEMHTFNKKLASQALKTGDIEQAGKRIDNIMKQAQSDQFRDMRPLELSRMKNELELLQERINHTRAQAKNEHEIMRLNKMEADLGKGIKILKDIMSGRGGRR